MRIRNEGSKAATHQTHIVTVGEAAIIRDESAWEDIGNASDASSTSSWTCAARVMEKGVRVDLTGS
jgi:hypothetical protein